MLRRQEKMVEKQNLYSEIKAKRLIQIYWVVQLAFLFGFFQCLYIGDNSEALILLIVSLSLTPVLKLARQGKVLSAAILLLWVTTLFSTYLIWATAGIYEELVLAYPGVLIVASIIGNKKLFNGLLLFISCSIAFNGISNLQEWQNNNITKSYLEGTVITVLVLWLISYIIWVFSRDVNLLLIELSQKHHVALKSKKKISMLLHHDLLTGLPNRTLAESLFINAVSRAKRHNLQVCLMFIDIDNFKQINDGLGHKAGDELLKELAKRFVTEVRNSDVVCRFAGDEFVIILESVKSEKVASRIAQNILNNIKTPFYYQSNELICSCSIGITLSPNNGEDFDTLMQQADTAMYQSKSIGGNSIHFFNKALNHEEDDYLKVVADLRKALREDQFKLFFQPKIDLHNDQIIGAEALIRWEHPKKGLLYPESFLPQVEKSGLMTEIGQWILQSATTSCQAWRALGFSDVSVAVNISSQQFYRNQFTTQVNTALESSQLPAQYLEVEITESLLIDNAVQVKEAVKYLSSQGVSFAIDDFGTGYSNLSNLKEFEIKALKIDRSFVTDIDQNIKNRALVSAIIQMAKALSLKTVAEGVETKAIADSLKALECDYAQGYYWAKPLCEEAFINLLQENISPLKKQKKCSDKK